MAKKATGAGVQVPSGPRCRNVKNPPLGTGFKVPEEVAAAVRSLPGAYGPASDAAGAALDSDARLEAIAAGNVSRGGKALVRQRGVPDAISAANKALGGGGWNSPRRGEFERSMQSGLSFRVLALIVTNVLLLRHSGSTDEGTFSRHRPAKSALFAALQEGSQQQNKSQLLLVKSQVQLPNEGSCVPSLETFAAAGAAAGGAGVDEELL